MNQDILTATKVYNEDKKMFQYVTTSGQVLITCKTEKGLEATWIRYKKIFQ